MAGTCVGPGFVVAPDGTLGLNGPRSGAWPYTGTGCGIAAANGLRLDAATGNLWAEPPDFRTLVAGQNSASPASAITTTPTLIAMGNLPVTNPDACRPTLITGSAAVTIYVNLPGGAGPQNVVVQGGIFQGAPPGTSTGQPITWYVQNQATLSGQAITPIETFTLPFSYTLAAGASVNITPGFWISAAGSGNVLNYWSWQIGAVSFTSRSSW